MFNTPHNRMSKRTVLPGAFALPGLASGPQESTSRDRISGQRQDIDQHSVEIETPRTSKTRTKDTKTNNLGNDSSSLVDCRGEFLPRSIHGRLEHLTKTRPRSPARRPAAHNTRRNRSRSPEVRCDNFNFTLGLNNYTRSENTNSKQPYRESENNCSRSANSKSNATARKSDVHVIKQEVVKGLNLAKITMTNKEETRSVSCGFDGYSKERISYDYNSKEDDSELSQQEFHSYSDEDLGDMLIGDYVDSDESDGDNLKPPLSSYPPPLDGDNVSQNKTVISDSGDSYSKSLEGKTTSMPRALSGAIDGNSKSLSLNTQSNSGYINDNSNGLHPSKQTSVNDSSIISENTAFLSSGYFSSRHPMSTLGGGNTAVSKSSSRRRRFKPVSVDDVIGSSKSDSVSKAGSFKTDNSSNDNEKMNRTFPGSYSEQLMSFESGSTSSTSSGYKKEFDWGLRTGTLNTSFNELTLKSGTIFDQFLKRKERGPNEFQSKKKDYSLNERTTVTTKKDVIPAKESAFENRRHKTVMPDDGLDRRTRGLVNNCALNLEDANEADDDDDVNDDDDDIKEYVHDSNDFKTSNIEYAGDIDRYSEDNDNDDKDDFHHSDSNDDDIQVSIHHDMQGAPAAGTHQGQSLNDNEIIGININISDDKAVSTEDEDSMDVTYTFDHTAERTCFNSVHSPGEILLDNEVCGDYSLNSRQGMCLPLKVDENGEYSVEILTDRNSKEYARDDGEEQEVKDNESLGSNQLPDDFDGLCHDNSIYAQYPGNTQFSESANDSNQEIHDDEVIEPPHLFNEEQETSNDEAEDLFEPPPMFASDEDELDFDDIPPPLNMSPVMSLQHAKKVMPFHKIPLVDWTEEDALHWLHYVGLGHFKEQFKAHHVDGRTLKNINFQLLEEIGISAPDERELVLSEIYDLDNPSEEEQLEAEIQDALETATEQDKEKILAVLTTLRSPTLNNSMDFPKQSLNESGSPMDSDPGYHVSSDTTSLASSVTASDEHSRKGSTNVTPSQPQHCDLHSASGHGQSSVKDTKNRDRSKSAKEAGRERKKTKERRKNKCETNKKDKKSISKFWESLSISHKSSKLTKLFGSKKLNPAMQYLLQSGPQGILRIHPTALSGQTKYCSFMVSMTTTSAQVVRMVLDKYDMLADPLRYYLCEIGLGKGGVNQVLEDGDCPLTWQCRWSDPEKYRFEMRCRDEGSVRMLFEMEEYKDDLGYRSIAVSSRTQCKDVMPLIIKKYDLPGNVEDYQLIEVSEDNEDDRRVVTDHVCPLKLQKAWSEPDHVFRLVRKHKISTSIETYLGSSAGQADMDPHPNLLPRTSSDASSLRGDYYETDSDHQDNTSEEALPGINKELEEVVMEVQDKISGQLTSHGIVPRSRGHSSAADTQLEDLKIKDAELQLKEKEIQDLKKERDELLLKENELLVWRLRNEELVEREEEVEKLRNSLVEKENQDLMSMKKELKDTRTQCVQLLKRQKELEEYGREYRKAMDELEKQRDDKNEELIMRDREIERLYVRNNDLVVKEKELEERMEDFMKFKTEFENKHVSSSAFLSKQKEVETKLRDLQATNESLQHQLDNATNMRLTARNAEEMVQLLQQLETAENDKKELQQKLEDFQRRIVLLERSAELLDSMRQENQALAAKAKEMDEMRRNIIRLTSQLREVDNLRLNQGELDDMKLRISICQAEKQQLQSRVEEVERHNCGLRENLQETDRLRNENRNLRDKVNELEEVRTNVKSLRREIQEAETLREKLLKVQGVEESLTKELKSKEALLRQKDERIDQQERKIEVMTDAMKKMERKFQEQNQQRETLTRLLNIIKDRDPGLLKTLHESLSKSERQPPQKEELEEEEEEDEEWC